MFYLFHIAMATSRHRFGFQVVCSAKLCVRLEGETLLGAQPTGTGAAPASFPKSTGLQDLAHLAA